MATDPFLQARPTTPIRVALRRKVAAGLRVLAVLAVPVACSDTYNPPAGPPRFSRNPCAPADTVTLVEGQATRIDCSGGGTTVTFAGLGASYLVVPQFASDQGAWQLVPYHVASGALVAASASATRAQAVQPAASRRSGALDGIAASGPGQAQMIADRLTLERSHRLAAAGAFRAAALRAPRPGTAAIVQAPPAVGSVRSFHVLSNFSTPTWTNVGAQLVYAGNSVLLYVDTLAPANGFTPTQLQTFGQYFDQVLFPIDTAAFGPTSDIDQNGGVIVLMSPVVNSVTPSTVCSTQGYVAGFFDPEDFDASNANSNNGEIFYSIVPDPAATVSCAHSVSEVDGSVPAVFLHELQHLIYFATHVITNGGQPGSSWMDEGLSIVSEELGSLYYEQKCPPPACRTDPAQLFPDSSQGFITGMLYDSYQYALLPDTASILLSVDSDQGFSWRGGAWLLMRWLGDQYGPSIYKALENGPASAVTSIAQATGRSFPALFADFGLALYTDSLPGLPRNTAPAANRFTSRNVKQLWARLFATAGPSTDFPLAQPVRLFNITTDTSTSVMTPGTMTFFRLDTPANATTVTVQFAAPGGTALPASLQPQIAIFRLPAGQ